MRILFPFLLFIAPSCQARAQRDTVFTNLTVFDGTDHAARTHANVVIKGDRISAISAGKINIPIDAIRIDMTGKYIMPEIINCHGHVGNLKGTTTSGENYTSGNVRRQLLQYQDYGVGAILSMGTEQPVGIQLRDSSQAGLIPGATMYSAIYGFGVKGA